MLIDSHNNAYGVEFIDKNSQKIYLHAKKEVIISAGTIGSPKILMLSGIGDRKHLEHHGIGIKSHVPAVGKNLYDSLIATVLSEQRIKPPKEMVYSMGVMCFHSFRSEMENSDEILQPDVQFQQFVIEKWGQLSNMHCLGVFLSHPKSHGTIQLASNRYTDDPVIDYNYLDSKEDLNLMIKGVRKAQEIMSNYSYAGEIFDPVSSSDEDIESTIRNLSLIHI